MSDNQIDQSEIRWLIEQIETAYSDECKIELLCEAVVKLLQREAIGMDLKGQD